MNHLAINLKFKNILILLRPYQYSKNLFIFLPLFFGGQITNLELLVKTSIAFVAFSFCASGVYILNDYLDIENDRNHLRKKSRPLASGAISTSLAMKLMLLFCLAGIILITTLDTRTATILGIYLIMNIAYSYWLKHISILDVTIIAFGFVLRLLVGSSVTHIPLSIWIIIMTFLLALFIALAKRRDDVLLYNETGNKMRKVLDGYNLLYLDSAMIIMASVVIVSYLLYSTSIEIVKRHNGEYIYFTSIFVVLGILRFLQNTFVEKKSGSPTMFVLKDLFMQITILAWIITFFLVLYV
jgi:decaprenyl-phosphate phosphoribosyltransferase